jgi:hypothetical protein
MDDLALLGDEALAMVHMPFRHLQIGLEKRHRFAGNRTRQLSH